MGFAGRIVRRVRDLNRDAARSFVLFDEMKRPAAGVHVRAPGPDQDEQRLTLSHLWFDSSPADLRNLVALVLERHPHEVAFAPLFGVLPAPRERLRKALLPLGFSLEDCADLRFELSEVPPLGSPLVLEAWNPKSEEGFRELYESAESRHISDRFWAWLKRWRGPFTPDLWFLARETLDQPPVGYAFCGATRYGLDGIYYLTGAGVMPDYRGSSEMLKRLVVSTLLDLSTRSPAGCVETTLNMRDPKLVEILTSLGFETIERYRCFVKEPE